MFVAFGHVNKFKKNKWNKEEKIIVKQSMRNQYYGDVSRVRQIQEFLSSGCLSLCFISSNKPPAKLKVLWIFKETFSSLWMRFLCALVTSLSRYFRTKKRLSLALCCVELQDKWCFPSIVMKSYFMSTYNVVKLTYSEAPLLCLLFFVPFIRYYHHHQRVLFLSLVVWAEI